MDTMRAVVSRTGVPKVPRWTRGPLDLWGDIEPGDRLECELTSAQVTVADPADGATTRISVEIGEETTLELAEEGSERFADDAPREECLVFSSLDAGIAVLASVAAEDRGYSYPHPVHGRDAWQGVNAVDIRPIRVVEA